ncbi:MAG: polysaccharide deacetylase family protein [Caldilineaceae bacterium]
MIRFVAPILAYHAVHPQRRDEVNVTPANFARQMAWLAQHGYRGVTLADYMARAAESRAAVRKLVALTFDDGYQDNLTHALPILQQYGFTATIFMITAMVGAQTPHHQPWLQAYPDVPPQAYQYLSWDELRLLQSQGMEIGSHTCSHPLLDQVDYAIQAYEVQQSKVVLEAALDTTVASFCYPAGHFTDDTLTLVRAAGYRQAVVTPWRRGLIRGGSFTLKRVGLYLADDLRRFRFKVSPLFDLYRTLRHRLARG